MRRGIGLDAASLVRVTVRFLALVCLLGNAALSAAPLARIGDVLQLSSEEASRELPIEVEGTVYFQDVLSGVLFLGHGDDFICVVNQKVELGIGTKVRILGKSGNRDGRRVMRADRVEVTSAASVANLAEPMHVDLSTVDPDEHDCRWIVTDAMVDGLRLHPGETSMSCRQGDVRFLVRCQSRQTIGQASASIGAKVRVTGNLLSQQGDESRGLVIASPTNVEIIDRGVHDFSELPIRTVDDLWNDRSAEEFRLWGQVTFAWKDAFFLETSNSGTYISVPSRLRPAVGSFVEVFGARESIQPEGGSLHARLLVNSGTGKLPYPQLMTAQEVLEKKPDSRRVRVRGEYEEHRSEDEVVRITLSSGGVEFDVYLSNQPVGTINLNTVETLEVSGTCSLYGDEEVQFIIHTPSLDDVRVVARSSTVDKSLVVAAVSAVTLALLGALLRSSYLRSQVRAGKRSLAEMSALLERSHDSSRDGMLVVADERVVHANRTLRELLGLPDDGLEITYTRLEAALADRVVDGFFIGQFRHLNRNKVASREFHVRLESPTGDSVLSLELFTAPVTKENGEFVGRFWAFYNITEREQLQESMLHASKQEAIGRMAGGLAHDFNNLLTGIKGNLFLARMDNRSLEQIGEHLEAADGAAQRAANLVSQLMRFSRKKRLDLATYSVNQLVERMLPLLRPALPSEDALVVELGHDLPEVRVDGIQIEQVLLNVCLNASDAIRDGGEITIKTTTERPKSQLHAVISVRDTGKGIPSDVLPHIFEPFFTTKNSEGTGLGLATAEGILRQHHGWIECDSQIGVGTEFRIFLPCATVLPKIVEPATTAPRYLEGLNILLVDDEDVVRNAIARILRTEGVNVHTAARGEEALELLSTQSEIDLVLLDWRMPGMSGREVLQRIKSEHADVPTIICSGYVVESDDVQRVSSLEPDGILQKPFSVKQVVKEARSAIQRSRKVT